MAPPIPRLKGRRITWTPRSAATPAVRSVEPASTTAISKPGSNAWISSITWPTDASSLKAGTIARRFNSPSRASTSRPAGAAGGAGASSATRAHWGSDADEVEDLSRAVRIRVLVEHSLAGATSHRFGRSRVVQQLAVRRERLVGVRDDAQLGARFEPALDSLVRIRDDRGTCRSELERATRRGRVQRGVRTASDVQVDASARDRLREHVERNVADVEHDGDAVAFTQPRGDAAEVRHRHGEHDHRGDVALALEDLLEVTLPARRHVAPDHLARELVDGVVGRILLGAAEVRVPPQPRGETARGCERLGLAVERV